MFINIMDELGGALLEVEKPARYTGGEYGRLASRDARFQTLIAFPDLYEIGMGNQALRIIYNRLNSIEGISCDRAFAPAPDFEKLLREKNIPLYGLDTGISLSSLDMLMFTIDYELGLSGILCMLDVSGIPLRCENRTEAHPIIIAGGPAISNPLPYSPFIDAFWIGDSEAGFFDLVKELSLMKREGQGRAELFEKIKEHPNIFVKGKTNVKRAIAADFASISEAAVFPIPSMKIVQHHGTVEIMRGCPNGCRFCHAGFWYRPMRQKNIDRICSHAREMVSKGGWREISLSSLSSGDYSSIGELIDTLNAQFKGKHISFQMPSLKVSSFSLDLLEKISTMRKSGLTFAVETPDEAWQMAINKDVKRDYITSILLEAKKRGWKSAKFYFLIGLPLNFEKAGKEEELILDFITDISRRTRMNFNINIALFVPKPHTPYERARQLDSAAASVKFDFLRSKLKMLRHKVSVSDTLISRIEGLMSRGDERAGYLFEEAYFGGSRLDAWSEYIKKDVWRKLFEENFWIENEVLSGKIAPWKVIDSGVTDNYLSNEFKRTVDEQYTSSCCENCDHNCGICNYKNMIIMNSVNTLKNISKNGIFDDIVNGNQSVNHDTIPVNELTKTDPSIFRLLFNFTKHDSAVFHGHLSLIEIFSMAFTRSEISALYTKGYNPLLKMEFASSLSTGISADSEIASVDFSAHIDVRDFILNINDKLPQGIRVLNAECFYIKSGMKKHSLSSLLWGFEYLNDNRIDYVKASEEKKYRLSRMGDNAGKSGLYKFNRKETLARNIINKEGSEFASYFDVYKFLYSFI